MDSMALKSLPMVYRLVATMAASSMERNKPRPILIAKLISTREQQGREDLDGRISYDIPDDQKPEAPNGERSRRLLGFDACFFSFGGEIISSLRWLRAGHRDSVEGILWILNGTMAVGVD